VTGDSYPGLVYAEYRSWKTDRPRRDCPTELLNPPIFCSFRMLSFRKPVCCHHWSPRTHPSNQPFMLIRRVLGPSPAST